MFDLMSILKSLSVPQQGAQSPQPQQNGMLFQQFNPAAQYMPQTGMFSPKPKAPDSYSAGSIPGIQTPQGGFQMPPPMPSGRAGKGGALGGGG